MSCRPGLTRFLDFAFKNLAVMVWSSAQPQNVLKMIRLGFGTHYDELYGIWDRRYCTLSGNYFTKCSSIKDLSRIWDGWSVNDSEYSYLYSGSEFSPFYANKSRSSSLDSGSDYSLSDADIKSSVKIVKVQKKSNPDEIDYSSDPFNSDKSFSDEVNTNLSEIKKSSKKSANAASLKSIKIKTPVKIETDLENAPSNIRELKSKPIDEKKEILSSTLDNKIPYSDFSESI
ncbi:hypothetical protein AYI70_g5184, partial [Smittium culicis]